MSSRKIAHNVTQPIFVKSNTCSMLRNTLPKILGYFCNLKKTAQSKQSHIGRKYAQSGHPVRGNEDGWHRLEVAEFPFTPAGLPDFSWYMIPKNRKNVPNYHKMYQMVIQYPKHP
jgi:hypothetical protein